MSQESKRKQKVTIPLIQKNLTYLLLFVLPFFIIPFPWDWTEKGMGLLILIISILVISLELVKLVWNGKVSLLKNVVDLGILVLLFSMLISTLFSVDFYTSLWGIDGRIGGGFLAVVSIVALVYAARNYIETAEDIKNCLTALLLGMGINNILSVLAFFGINIWGFIPLYRDLGQVGLPILRSAKIHILFNFVNIALLVGLLLNNFFSEKKKSSVYTLAGILLVFSVVNVSLFSINQGFNLVILFVVLLGGFTFLMFRKLKISDKERKKILPMIGAVLLGVIVPSSLLQINAARSLIIPPNLDLVTQLTLGTDVSWVVSASVFVDSLWRGLVGMGMDTYSVAFNKFKPLTQNLLNLNNVNFYSGGNEVFTQFANGGLFWLLAWMFFGFLIYKLVRRDYEELKSYKNSSLGLLLLFIDFTIAFIFLASLFSTYTILIVFTLILLISLETILRNILKANNTDKFVIKLWAVDLNTSSEGKGGYNVNVFLTALIVLLTSATMFVMGSRIVSSAYLLKAESYFVEQNLKFQGDVYPSMAEREAFVNSMSSYYTQAARYDRNNPLINRKDGLMSLEKVGIASEKYTNASEEEESNELIRNVGVWKNYAVDSTRKSLDTSPAIYDNWEARIRTYMGLIGLGFGDYTTDAIYALDKAIALKPLNYELYYSKAQIYLINGEKDNSLAALTEEFGINPQHVPSLLLAGEINREKGNVDIYESYLKAAKKVLEASGQEDSEAYRSINTQLNEIPSDVETVEETQTSEDQNTVDVQDTNITVQ